MKTQFLQTSRKHALYIKSIKENVLLTEIGHFLVLERKWLLIKKKYSCQLIEFFILSVKIYHINHYNGLK